MTAEIAWRLPEGYSRVVYRDRAYGLTVRRFNGGRSVKIFAEALDGSDIVSANVYRGASGDLFRPCEMSASKVEDFLAGLDIVEPAAETGRPRSHARPSKTGRRQSR